MKALRQDCKETQHILGWLSYSAPDRVTGCFPPGHGGNAEQGDDVTRQYLLTEQALANYREYWAKLQPQFGPSSEKMMRNWLREIYWESRNRDAYGPWAHLVMVEVRRLIKMLRECIEGQLKEVA